MELKKGLLWKSFLFFCIIFGGSFEKYNMRKVKKSERENHE